MLTHKGTQNIQTERLTLRRFEIADAQAMFDNWANDERVTRFLTWTPHDSPESSKQLLESWCAAYENESTYNWAIEFEGKVIGNISVVRFNEKHEYADLGYCMGYDFWNKGIMTEAAKAVIHYLFEEIGFHRLVISHAAGNPASGRVAQKCGLSYEGTRRECYKQADGTFLDLVDYAVLKDV